MKKITQEQLEQSISETVNDWDMQTLIGFANDVMLEDAMKNKYAVCYTFDEDMPLRFSYGISEHLDDLLDEEEQIFEIEQK